MLDKLLDKTKIKAFWYREAAVLGTLLARLNFKWDKTIPTACCGDGQLKWNPDWFQSLSEESRVAVLLHELWHIARLHNVRLGNRDPKLWNMACDYRINNDLVKDGYSFEDAGGLIDPSLDGLGRLSEEEIYNVLKMKQEKAPSSYVGDIIYSKPGSASEMQSVQLVQAATQQAQMAGAKTDSEVEEILAQLLKPVVPWRRLLRQFFMDISKEDYSWKRPNRRYEDVYLPSMTDDSKLTALNYYIDTSGSIETSELIRFNSELKNIWEDLQPTLLRVINFDTEIQSETEIRPDQPFDYFKFTGRGGTSLEPVMEHIQKTKPTAAIIFSDLFCKEPKQYPKVPIIWIVIGNPKANPSYGITVHIPREELIRNGRKR